MCMLMILTLQVPDTFVAQYLNNCSSKYFCFPVRLVCSLNEGRVEVPPITIVNLIVELLKKTNK